MNEHPTFAPGALNNRVVVASGASRLSHRHVAATASATGHPPLMELPAAQRTLIILRESAIAGKSRHHTWDSSRSS